jgi:hypothetical protein
VGNTGGVVGNGGGGSNTTGVKEASTKEEAPPQQPAAAPQQVQQATPPPVQPQPAAQPVPQPQQSPQPQQPAPAPTTPAKKDKSQKRLNKELAPCRQVLDDLESHDESWPFLLAVNTKQFPTYRKVIRNPMDLQTISKRLSANE